VILFGNNFFNGAFFQIFCPDGSINVTAQAGTVIPGNNRRKIQVVRKELCYGKAETLEDAEEAARWWRYNLVR